MFQLLVLFIGCFPLLNTITAEMVWSKLTEEENQEIASICGRVMKGSEVSLLKITFSLKVVALDSLEGDLSIG